METFIEYLKAIVFGLVEGLTEWLPVSSTGHMIILNEFFSVEKTQGKPFYDFFLYVIQFAAILAVVIYFFKKLWPFGKKKSAATKRHIWRNWGNILIASVPATVLGIILSNYVDQYLMNYLTVSVTLIVYGILFLVIELYLHLKTQANKKRFHLEGEVSSITNSEKDPYGIFRIHSVYKITPQMALLIGLAEVLAIIPGTSRSGVTICMALILSIDRETAAEFSFFLAIPVMVGTSLFKGGQFIASGASITGTQIGMLLTACAVAFGISLLVTRGFLRFLRSNSFVGFGIYRIVLGIVLLVVYYAYIVNRDAAASILFQIELMKDQNLFAPLLNAGFVQNAKALF
jgi:undecaprenyl-diphosphatase